MSRIRRISNQLKQAVIRLMRAAVSLGDRSKKPKVIGDQLDDLMGTWSAGDVAEMDAANADFERTDEQSLLT